MSRTYFTNVNVSNTVINNSYVTNAYDTRNVTNATYVNQQVLSAVVTVPTTAFVQSQSVASAALRVPHEAVVRAPVNPVAEVAPIPARERALASHPGRPVDPAALPASRPTAPVPAPKVEAWPRPVSPPPVAAPEPKAAEAADMHGNEPGSAADIEAADK